MKTINLLSREEIVEEMVSKLKEDDSYAKQEDEDRDDWFERVYESAWVDDYITGNGSGYWGSKDIPELDLIREAFLEFDVDLKNKKIEDFMGIEYVNITVRCYLLNEAIEEYITED